jgi:hypothetical protein
MAPLGRAILEPAHLGARPDIAALLEEQEREQAQAREAQVAQGPPTEPQGQQELPAVVVEEPPKEEQEEEKAEAGAVAVGGRVELQGLVSAREHNGKRGTGHPRHPARATAW